MINLRIRKYSVGFGRRTITEPAGIGSSVTVQLFVTPPRASRHSIVAFLSPRGTASADDVLLVRAGLCWREAMDWRHTMERTDPVRTTEEEEAAYAAGWTISGLATIGTIIVVWMFAI
jgi:hypothetical protein